MLNKNLAYKIFEGFSIQRWNDLVRPFDIVEMDKAAEKMMIAYIIGKFEEHDGKYIDWEWMAYASVFDLLKKIVLCDIKAPIQRLLKKEYRDEYLRLDEWVLSQYRNILDEELFSRFTIYIAQRAGTLPVPENSALTFRVYIAAHKYSSVRELDMISVVNERERLEKIRSELDDEMRPFIDLKGLQMFVTRGRAFKLLMKLEQLRFQTRWNQTPRVPRTSVMGHSFFVAALTLLLGRDTGFEMCADRVSNNFFSALFHDFPEAVTRDIISPVKQATDALPNVVKKLEDEIVSTELLPLMENFYADELMYFTTNEFANRIFIDGKQKEVSWAEMNAHYNSARYKSIDGKLVRVADHLSALMEADISIKHGITSSHLTSGRDSMLSRYEKGVLVNGIDVATLFKNIAE